MAAAGTALHGKNGAIYFFGPKESVGSGAVKLVNKTEWTGIYFC